MAVSRQGCWRRRRAAFVDATGDALLVTAAVCAGAAIVAFAFLPAREIRTPEETEAAFAIGTLPPGQTLLDWLLRPLPDRRDRE